MSLVFRISSFLSCMTLAVVLSIATPVARAAEPSETPGSSESRDTQNTPVPKYANWSLTEGEVGGKFYIGGFGGYPAVLGGGTGHYIYSSGFKLGVGAYAGGVLEDSRTETYVISGLSFAWDMGLLGRSLILTPQMMLGVGLTTANRTGSHTATFVMEPGATLSVRLTRGIRLGFNAGVHIMPMYDSKVAFVGGVLFIFRRQTVDWLTDEGVAGD